MSIHKTAMIDPSCEIDPSVDIGPNVVIEKNVVLKAGVKIMANAYIAENTEIGENTAVHVGALIGGVPQDYAFKGQKTFTKIGKNNIIREYVTIHRGTVENSATVVGDNNFIMVQCHLGHNCVIGNNVILVTNALLAGYVQVEDSAFVSGNVVFHQFCRIGRFAMIGGFTGVNKDVPPYMLVRGPSTVRGVNLVGLRRSGMKREVISEIKEAYKILYTSDLTVQDAVAKMKNECKSPEVAHLIKFLEESKRGICKYRYSREDYWEE